MNSKSYTADIVVSGAGTAGAVAAIAAADQGKDVVLIEQYGIPGGSATLSLVTPLMHTGIKGNPMCSYISDEINRRMLDAGASVGKGDNWLDPMMLGIILEEMLMERKVKVLYHTTVIGAETEGKTITCVNIFNKSGHGKVYGKMFIDATGDADLTKLSGAPFVDGDNFFTYIAYEATLESCEKAVKEKSIGHLYHWINGGKATLYGQFHPDGMKKYTGTTGEEVTEYVVKNQMELLDSLRGQDPASRDIAVLPTMPQFRTTRHIKGMYTLKADDAYKHFDDSVCLINDFDRRDYLYEVPLRCLIAETHKNLLAVGRAASAEGYAWDVLRVIPPAILTGQAAGVAACRAIDEGAAIQDVDISGLQKALEEKNVYIHMIKELMPEERL